MMQFNMYHHYTVDEHLLRTVGNITAIETGDLASELPLSTAIVKSIQNRRALYVAAFLHDIGKGRKEDHSIVGARIARKLCPRLGLTAAETELVVWLIEQHLTMSNVAHSRDISDPETVRDFADIVQSPERLKLLHLLTCADIRAVGPGVWNGWKGQLLRTSVSRNRAADCWRAYPVQPQGTHRGSTKRFARGAERVAGRRRSTNLSTAITQTIGCVTETKTQVEHAELLRQARASKTKLATRVKTDAFTAITELTVFAPNHARLLSLFAGACAAAGSNIAGAHITTTRDGFALDTFLLNREFKDDADELRRAKRIGEMIDRLLEGKDRLAALLQKKRPASRSVEAFTVEPEVIINNALSERLTVH